ncbi:MAG: hypothetical protein U5K37_08435 [Natrialbaceae archaeon]|nr:hypothetical protein [Natrialbaceae archaeon]
MSYRKVAVAGSGTPHRTAATSRYGRWLVRVGLLLGTLLLASVVLSGGVAADAPDCNNVNFWSGNGTAQYPYEVHTVDQLQCVAHENTSTAYDDYYIQMDDIDASETQSWNTGAGFMPIGTESTITRFEGEYDGNNYEITGLHINRPSHPNVGLFSTVEGFGGSITDLTVTDADIRGGQGLGNVGILVGEGRNSPSIVNVRVTGMIDSDAFRTGGVAGDFDGNIFNTTADISIQSSGAYTGGLVGEFIGGGSDIDKTQTSGSVSGGGYRRRTESVVPAVDRCTSTGRRVRRVSPRLVGLVA